MKATLHLLFQGTGEAALAFYEELFPDLNVEGKTHRPDGSLETARFHMGGMRIQIHNDTHTHAFGFTPALSIFLDLSDAAQQERLVTRLSEEGKVMMPLDNYGFSTAFAWVEDTFGVSWQLNRA